MADGIVAAAKSGTVRLHLHDRKAKKIAGSLSAVERIDDMLWLAGDEVSSIERLARDAADQFGGHTRISLVDVFQLEGDLDDEADLEGIGYDDEAGLLWVVASHSMRRGKDDQEPASLATVTAALQARRPQQNRFLLGSVAVERGGVPMLDPATARFLPRVGHTNALTDFARASPLLRDFMETPSKDNGFDIEGIAARAGEVFIGLRGPVMDGWASILQLSPVDTATPHLAITGGGVKRAPRHHLLDLDGLGVRDLCVLERDLLILAGPTMATEGPYRVFRWKDGAVASEARLVRGDTRELVFEIPSGGKIGKPEGMTLYDTAGAGRLLVVYDRPAEGGQKDDQTYEADLFDLP